MSRTFALPVDGDLTGLPTDLLPENLTFTQLKDLDGLTPSQRRLYYPNSFDPITGIYSRADQRIEDLGLIDPVDVWSRSGGQQGSTPDDMIASISIRAQAGDPTGDALVTVVDAFLSPRFASFVVPLAPDGQTPGRVATRYGLPIFTGDMILVDWLNRPAITNAASILLNLSPADGCCMQKATAAWFAVNGEGPVPPACTPPIVLGMTSAPAPIFALSPFESYTLTIPGIGFQADDVVAVSSGPPGVIISSFGFISPGEFTAVVDIPAGTPPSGFVVSVSRALDPGCSASAGLPIVDPA